VVIPSRADGEGPHRSLPNDFLPKSLTSDHVSAPDRSFYAAQVIDRFTIIFRSKDGGASDEDVGAVLDR